MHPTRALLVASAPLLASAAAAQLPPEGDVMARVLAARAALPAEPVAAADGTVGAGNRLFYLDAPDNAPCVRGFVDVTNDGVPEVLVGVDESGVPNVFCLDGTSSGAATTVWSIQTMDGASGGSPYGDQCMTVASDADGNGTPNVLLGTAWGGRTAYGLDGLAGAQVWKYDTYLAADSGWVYSVCEMSDVTGDGVPECAFGVGSMSDSVYLVSGASTPGQAEVRWRYDAGDAVYVVRNLGDVNGDGDDDVLAAVGDNADRVVCLDGGTSDPAGSVLWSYSPGTSVYTCEVIPDVTGDGIDDALAGLWTFSGTAVRCLDGTDGSIVWTTKAVPENVQLLSILADVTGDGLSEVIVGSWENAVRVLDGSDGTLVWVTTVGTTNGGDVWTARAIDDLNGDGRQDVIAGSFDTNVYAMDGDSGEVFWAFGTGNRLYSVDAVPDLNGDGTPDVVAGTQDTTSSRVVHVLEGDAGIAFPGFTVTGSGAIGTSLELEITGPAGDLALPAYSATTASVSIPPLTGTLGLGSPFVALPSGTIPTGGAYVLSASVPLAPGLVGQTVYLQGAALTVAPFGGAFTDVESVTFLGG